MEKWRKRRGRRRRAKEGGSKESETKIEIRRNAVFYIQTRALHIVPT